MKIALHLLFALFFFAPLSVLGQDDLLNILEEEEEPRTYYTQATFKGTRIINLQSTEIPGAGVMQFVVLHRFGAVNDRILYNFFGLDNSSVRLSLDYSFNDWLNVGVGRSSGSRVYDGWVKTKILRQSSGAQVMPISLLYYGSMNVNTTTYTDGYDHSFSDRVSYVNQLIVARKFSDRFSLELAPTLVHFNLRETEAQMNTLFGLGAGARYKITSRVAITADYMHQVTRNTRLVGGVEEPYNHALSIGVDIETGGHVFQLHVTNAQDMSDPGWTMSTPGSWSAGDIYFGFNISRVFTLVRPKQPEAETW